MSDIIQPRPLKTTSVERSYIAMCFDCQSPACVLATTKIPHNITVNSFFDAKRSCAIPFNHLQTIAPEHRRQEANVGARAMGTHRCAPAHRKLCSALCIFARMCSFCEHCASELEVTEVKSGITHELPDPFLFATTLRCQCNTRIFWTSCWATKRGDPCQFVIAILSLTSFGSLVVSRC